MARDERIAGIFPLGEGGDRYSMRSKAGEILGRVDSHINLIGQHLILQGGGKNSSPADLTKRTVFVDIALWFDDDELCFLIRMLFSEKLLNGFRLPKRECASTRTYSD